MSHLPDRDHDGGYERLVEAVGDGVYALGADSTFLDVNASLVEMSGYDAEEILETGPWLWHDDEDIDRFEAALRRLLAADDEDAVETVEATMETADGEPLPIEVTLTLLPTEDGEYAGHVGVVREIGDRKEREQELEEYASTVRVMPDEVYTLDVEGRFRSILPPTGSELTTSGYDPAELVGEHVSAVMDEADVEQGQEVIRGILADDDRERDSFEMEVVTKSGERIPHENHIALLPTEAGDGFRGTVGVLRDISERKARERALERQNERLEEFASVVSHDLRNPLNVAMGYQELLAADYDDDRLESLGEAHERMAALVDDVLTLAREGESVESPSAVALRTVARQAWAVVHTRDATIGATGDLTLQADEQRLQRLLENLFRNAVEHGSTSPPSSSTHEDAGRASSSEPSVADAPEDAVEHGGSAVTVTIGPLDERGGGTAGFFVEDDGPGIPADERTDVFESGYSSAPDGTGIGLAIVARIADGHGWDVRATEGTDGGARFEFTGVETA